MDEGGLDVDALTAPLPGGAVADPRSGPDAELYLSLKDWRAEARAAEREASQSGDAAASPLQAGVRRWREVVDGGARLLAATAKDLEVAGWVCEGLLRTDGFPGLAQGLELLARLVETWWDEGLRPEADEDGDETRLAPLFGLFGRGGPGALIQPIKLVPLTDLAGDAAPVALWTVETAFQPPARSDDEYVRERLLARHAEEVARVTGAVARASPAFLRRSAAGLEGSLAMVDRLMTAVAARTQEGRFGSQVVEPLQTALRLLHDQAPAVFAAAAAEAAADASPAGEVAAAFAPDASAAAPRAGWSDREQALNALEGVAVYFERHEPQSMIGQSLREVVRRAKLPFADLMAELLPDAEQRALFLQRAGIRGDQPLVHDGY